MPLAYTWGIQVECAQLKPHCCTGYVSIVDASEELPNLKRKPGLTAWKVRDPGAKIPAGEATWYLLCFLVLEIACV
eukprot:COSAG05_NODE_3397_length_2087_cov_1.442153_1_plen_76_part_00